MQQLILIPATIAAAACITDLQDNQIKNPLILTGYAAGFWYIIYRQGVPGIPLFFGRAILPIAIFYILFVIGVLGAGDIKLFSVLSTFLTLKETGTVIILSFLLGAIAALFRMLFTRELWARIAYFSGYASLCIGARRLLPYQRLGKNSTIHFSVPIFISFILTEVIS
jgi:prepilin peptidase CpaA